MRELNELFGELYKFSSDILTLNEPLKDKLKLNYFEDKHQIVLPKDFKEFLITHNGIDLMGITVYGFDGKENLENVYEFEHNQVVMPQYKYIVPFSNDGGGNFYCFDTRVHDKNSCPVIFWVSSYLYSSDNPPEIVNQSFIEWFNEVVIDWTLESYDYYGNERQ